MKPNELTVDNTWSIKLLVLVSINGRIINVDPPIVIDRDKFLCISGVKLTQSKILNIFLTRDIFGDRHMRLFFDS
jgi:hypothetical protein